jgi:hypothetical protein
MLPQGEFLNAGKHSHAFFNSENRPKRQLERCGISTHGMIILFLPTGTGFALPEMPALTNVLKNILWTGKSCSA